MVHECVDRRTSLDDTRGLVLGHHLLPSRHRAGEPAVDVGEKMGVGERVEAHLTSGRDRRDHRVGDDLAGLVVDVGSQRNVPHGNTVTNPAPDGPTAVTFNESAPTPLTGTPPTGDAADRSEHTLPSGASLRVGCCEKPRVSLTRVLTGRGGPAPSSHQEGAAAADASQGGRPFRDSIDARVSSLSGCSSDNGLLNCRRSRSSPTARSENSRDCCRGSGRRAWRLGRRCLSRALRRRTCT